MKSNKIKKQFRQGDVLIEMVESAPVTPARKEKRVILAHGEVTGHAHEVADPGVASIEEVKEAWRILGDLPDADGMTRSALQLGADTEIKHQEHSQIPLSKGVARVTRQREYSPEAIRNVQD